jgi:2-oxoglutarate dehydrogenase E2 component (dihydrolipoamide succinyltransferase)
MLIQVKVPSVGESITEGLLAEWMAKDGDVIRSDDPLFVLETDKVTMTINAEHSGQLKILVQAGEPVKIGQVIGELDTSVTEEADSRGSDRPIATSSAQPSVLSPLRPQSAGPPMTPPAGLPQAKAKLDAAALDDLAPSVRRLVEEERIDPRAIPGTGRGGRVTKEDVLAFLSTRGRPDTPVRPASPGGSDRPITNAPASPHPSLLTPHSSPSRQTRTPLSPIRQRIAERMLLSQQNTATLTTFSEADMGEIMALRAQHKEAFQAKHGVGLGFMSFFVRAAVDGLQAFPALAATIDGGDLVQNHTFDIGIAVSTDRGLVVPVLRDPDKKSLAGIERDIAELAKRAREKRITLPELEGAVFSITNAGSYGALFGTPILNPPQSGILGTYAIQQRPVARDGQVVIRPMMYLALSYDHRVVDGETAGRFLQRVTSSLEHPVRPVLEI